MDPRTGFRKFAVSSVAAVFGLAGVVLAAAPATTAAMPSVYYVSLTGSNTNTGASVSTAFGTIQYAVVNVPPGSTILVEPGTYSLSTGGPVTITEDVTLESDAAHGGSASNTILDATGLSNGIVIAGPGSAGTTVMGLTVENAQKAGLVALATTGLTIWGNIVQNNDQSCATYGPECSNPGSNNGIPFGVSGSNVSSTGTPFTATNSIPCGNAEAGGSDCEALHLIGVTNSTVRGNTVQNNLDGGIYLTDEVGPTTGNLIADNVVQGNLVDCGITLASHVPGNGVSYNTVTGNLSEDNGAAGIILATPVPGGILVHNAVTHNRVIGNGLGGIDIHTHVAGSMVSHNVIAANMVSGNAPDFGVSMNPTTREPEAVGISIGAAGSPITDTVVTGNIITNETVAVYVTLLAQGTVVGGNR